MRGGKNNPAECANLEVWFESVAQLVEHRPFKALVLGSSPSALTIKIPTKSSDLSHAADAALRSPEDVVIRK